MFQKIMFGFGIKRFLPHKNTLGNWTHLNSKGQIMLFESTLRWPWCKFSDKICWYHIQRLLNIERKDAPYTPSRYPIVRLIKEGVPQEIVFLFEIIPPVGTLSYYTQPEVGGNEKKPILLASRPIYQIIATPRHHHIFIKAILKTLHQKRFSFHFLRLSKILK